MSTKTEHTPDELNDLIRAQVEREIPTPPSGFETDQQAEEHKAKHEVRFFQIVNDISELK